MLKPVNAAYGIQLLLQFQILIYFDPLFIFIHSFYLEN